MLTNDPEIYAITQFNPVFDWRFNQSAICWKVPIIAATDLRTFESDRRKGLFFLLSLSFITIHDCMHVCSTYDSLYTCFIRKNDPPIKLKGKKYAAARIRTFNLPIRICARYPYTMGWEGIWGRIQLCTLGFEIQKYSESVFTTSNQRTVNYTFYRISVTILFKKKGLG